MVEGMKLSPKTAPSKKRVDPKGQQPAKKGKGFKPKAPKRKWIPAAIAGVALLGAGVGFNSETVMASVNSATMTVRKATGGTEFDQKEALTKNQDVQTESDKAFDGIDAAWTDNSVEDIKAEIVRQQEAGLPIYIIQWGDTLSVLAEALGSTVDTLAKANNVENDDLILTGDVLRGVLSTEQLDQAKPAKESQESEAVADKDATVADKDVVEDKDTNTSIEDNDKAVSNETEDKDDKAADQADKESEKPDEPVAPDAVADDADKDKDATTPDEPKDVEDVEAVVIEKDEVETVVDKETDDANQAIVDDAKDPDDVIPDPVPNPDSDKPVIEPSPDVYPPYQEPDVDEDPVVVPDNNDIDGDVTVTPGEVPDEDKEDFVDDGDKEPDGDAVYDRTMITTVTTTPLLYGTTYVADDTLAKDETKVITEGKNGSAKETQLTTYQEDGSITVNTVGDEVRVEAVNQVIHYGQTDEEYVSTDFRYGAPTKEITDMAYTGKGQSKALEQLALGNINAILAGMGYATEVTPEFVGVMFNTITNTDEDYIVDNQFNIGLNHVIDGNTQEHTSIDVVKESIRLTNTLAGIQILNQELDALSLSLFAVSAKGISSDELPMALVEINTDTQKIVDIDALNKEYQDTIAAVVSAIDQHMKQVYSDEK